MSDERTVPAHFAVRKITDVIEYGEHPPRKETALFRHNKQTFHTTGAKCFIDNGYCSGHLEIHHEWVEDSAATEVDWAKVTAEHGFTDVDAMENLMPLCEKHHRGIGTGIHMVTEPAWRLQRYMTADALARFDAKITELIELGHSAKHVNHVAHELLTGITLDAKTEVSV